MTIVRSADCTGTITAMTKMVTVCVIAVLVRLIHMREVKKMTDDTISRAAAIDAFLTELTKRERKNFLHTWSTVEVKYFVADMLEKLPSEQPGWIPTSERLPKPNEYENNVRQYYLIQNEYGDMMVCSWHGGFWTQMYRNTHVEDKVVAWMPLPAPYRREGGQDNGTD